VVSNRNSQQQLITTLREIVVGEGEPARRAA
jgi:hypothetical protein